MKKLIWIMTLTFAVSAAYSQKSIDALFDQYADTDGFTSVTLSGNLLNFAAKNEKDKDFDYLPGKVTEIRILAQDKNKANSDNFYEIVMKDINIKDYEEFMKVKQYDQDIRMLVKTEGDRFREFLLVGGGKDNFIIQIKGNMSLNDAEKFSSDVKKNHGRDIL
jgi:hypothetical protein